LIESDSLLHAAAKKRLLEAQAKRLGRHGIAVPLESPGATEVIADR
jgi:hypothetical protein